MSVLGLIFGVASENSTLGQHQNLDGVCVSLLVCFFGWVVRTTT